MAETTDFRDVTGSKGNGGGCCQGLARRDNEFSWISDIRATEVKGQ